MDLERIDGYYAYRCGQTFYWYVAEKYGEEKIGDLINKIRAYGSLDNAFKSAFHMSLKDFSEQWITDMKKIYWPDITRYKSPKEFSERLTEQKKDKSYYNSSPAISPDGDKMAYISALGGEFGIFISDLRTGKERKFEKIISSNRAQDFEDLNMVTPGITWSPDGKYIAVSAKAGGTDAIYKVDIRTEDYEKLNVELPSIASVNWSPNGKYIAFSGSESFSSDIYLYDTDTKTLSRITNDVFTDIIPEWAPDSKTIYFISDRGDNLTWDSGPSSVKIWKHKVDQSDIYSIDINSKEIKKITNTPWFEKSSLAISSDGKKMLFVSDENGIGNLYQMDIATRSYKPKTNSLNGLLQISLARDDSKLLFCTQIDGGYDIFMLNFPFDKPFVDSLPLTEYRWKEQEKQRLIEGITSDLKNGSDNSIPEKDKTEGYGDVSIEFSRQQVVKPNPEVASGKTDGEPEAVPGIDDDDSVFAVKNYKLKFSPDLVQGNPGFSTYYGVQGVAQMLFSDVLGDHQIYFYASLLYDLRNSNFFIAYSYLPNKIDYQASAYHTSYFVQRSDGMIYRFRDWGGGLSTMYPFNRFSRIELELNLKNLSRENIDSATLPAIERFLLVPGARYVYDDVSYGYYGPINGTRCYVDLKGTPRLSSSGREFATLKFDYRRYFQIGTWSSLVLRGTAGASIGSNPQNFFLGGTENWFNSKFKNDYLPFDEPEDFAFMEFIMPLRGVSVNEATGNRFFLGNAEYRFPIAAALWTETMPIMLQALMGAVFVDVGGAWNGSFSQFWAARTNLSGKSVPKHLLLSSGLGLRSYIFGLPVKLDVAWQYLYWNWTAPMWMVSLGYDF